ncbi:MAG TPA: hypothetical protein VMD47_02605 [Candidatus Acidoferrales bacterium]|nr:hypothetical protein [Candidatus Acidoferrales bacterium]
MSDLIFRQNPWIFIVLVLVVLLATLELAYRFCGPFARRAAINDDLWNAIQTGLLALLAFMLSLSFAQAEGRFDARRALMVKEANAIGTTWLRSALLPEPARTEFRKLLRDDTSARLEGYGAPRNRALWERMQALSDRDQDRLWTIAASMLHAQPSKLGYSLLMETLNAQIDTATEQRAALTQHIPVTAVLLTVVLMILSVFSIGLSFARAGKRPAIFSLVYIVAVVLVFQMAIDFDRPQTGFVRVSLGPIRWQLESMK